MKQVFHDGMELSQIWWGDDSSALAGLRPGDGRSCVKALTIREQFCGDRDEWFVEVVRTDGAVLYHNMRFIAGFRIKEGQG